MMSRQLEFRAHTSTQDTVLVVYTTSVNTEPETICTCLVFLGLASGVPVSGRKD